MDVDFKSKDYWLKRLSKKGFNVVDTNTTIGQFAHWDIEATLKGITYYIELKDRNVFSTTYGDNSIEKIKYESIKTQCSGHKDRIGLTISMFKDGVFYMNKIEDEHTESKRWAPKTTSFYCREKVLKDFVDYKPRFKGEYKYE